MHGDADTTLERSTDVISVPCNTHGYQGVDARSSEESTDILDGRLAGRSKHSESYDGDDLEGQHEDTTLAHLIGKETSSDGENTSYNVDRYGHQLTLFVCVAHVLDDGRQEQRDGVQRRVDTDGDQHVHVDLPILECVEGVFHVELVSERAAVGLETTLYFGALFLCEELGTVVYM